MKCIDKKYKKKVCSCSENINHLNRIEGQIRTLKKYMQEGRRCEDVAMLTTSIAKSFDTLRATTLKNFFINDVFESEKISKFKMEQIDKIFKLYKK